MIDGDIAGERLLSHRPELKDQPGPDGMLEIDAIALAYWTQRLDPRARCSSLEQDVLGGF